MSNMSNIGTGKPVSSSSFTYHVEMEEGHVGAEFPSIEQALEGHTDGAQSVKVWADWQAAEPPATPGTETATITFHDRPCGIMVRVPAQSSVGTFKTTTQQVIKNFTPWRVVNNCGSFEIWTAEDETPGSLNNFMIADGIQSEAEANVMVSAPDTLALLYTLLPYIEMLKDDPTYKGGVIAKRISEIRAVISKAEGAK